MYQHITVQGTGITLFRFYFVFSSYLLSLAPRMWLSTLVWRIYLNLEHQRFLKDLLVFAILMGKAAVTLSGINCIYALR